MIHAKQFLTFALTVVLTYAPSQARAQHLEKVTIAAGTKFKAALQTPISSKLSEVGDTVVLSLLEPIPIDPQHILPRGTELTGKITFVKRAGRMQGRAEVYALIHELTTDYGSEAIAVSIASADDIANDEKIKTDKEGKLKSNLDLGGDIDKAIKGATLGSLGSTPVALATRSIAPVIAAPGVGAIAAILLTRGKEIRLPVGAVFRMKFDRDLILPTSITRIQVGGREGIVD